MNESSEQFPKVCPFVKGPCNTGCIFLTNLYLCDKESPNACIFEKIGIAADIFQMVVANTDFTKQKDVINNISEIVQLLKQKTIKKGQRPMAKCKKKKPVKK
jgi:hypothetical protein